MVSVLVAGDFCPDYFYKNEELFESPQLMATAAEIAEITGRHHIAMVNVETVYTDSEERIIKSGPNIKSASATLPFLEKMGFGVAACANNHIGDYGERGVLDTLKVLRRMGMRTLGAGENENQAKEPCYITTNGMTVAILNCCEHEFGTAHPDKAGSAAVDWAETGKLIQEAREKADAVVVYIHGGNEHNPLPRPGMKKLCHHFVHCGASAIVVGHSHCPQGIEVYEGVPIAYGIGNFYFPHSKKDDMWNRGYLVSLELAKNEQAKLTIIPYEQKRDAYGLTFLKGQEEKEFSQYMECISSLMQDGERYEQYNLAWCSMYMKDNLYHGLTGEKPLPECKVIRNLFTCESHNELIKTYFKALCDGKIDKIPQMYYDNIRKLQQGMIVDY